MEDGDLAHLFPRRGQPAERGWRLALIATFQLAENLSDRQAADAVRARIDWKYALGLDLENPGFNRTVLSGFRGRSVESHAERLLLDLLLERFRRLGLLKAHNRADRLEPRAAQGNLFPQFTPGTWTPTWGRNTPRAGSATRCT